MKVLATAASTKSWAQAAKPDTEDSAADVPEIMCQKISHILVVRYIILKTAPNISFMK